METRSFTPRTKLFHWGLRLRRNLRNTQLVYFVNITRECVSHSLDGESSNFLLHEIYGCKTDLLIYLYEGTLAVASIQLCIIELIILYENSES
jgi:hypothetical protein